MNGITVKDVLDGFKKVTLKDAIDEQAMKIVIEALEKQVGKKPVKPKKWMVDYRCPVCECSVETEISAMGFCDNCGQKIDWSVEE